MRRWLALFCLIAMAQIASAADATVAHMAEPRGFGHFVGDVITRTAEIDAEPGETFVAASLPQPGQLAYWLELRNVEPGSATDAGARRLTLRLTYQLFYVPIDTHKVKIPASNVEVKSQTGSRLVTLPAFTFLISSVREIYPEKSGETTETFLKEDAVAERLKTGRARTAVLASAISSAFALALLAFHRAWWPFHARPRRPFTEARRTVFDHRQNYATALVALHRAFDSSNGERLLAGDLDRFFASRPEQQPAQPRAQRFFAASQDYFFAGDPVAAEAALPRSSLEALAEELAANERAER